MKLFFDCETTGKALMRAPLEHPAQPHIVQLAGLLCDDDGREAASLNIIIRPNQWVIPEEAAAIHGITTEFAAKCGIPIGFAIDFFRAMAQEADTAVAHNIDFDAFMLSLECLRGSYGEILPAKRFCTMKSTTQICKLPGNYGDYKWPKLTEAHKHLFGTDVEKAHDAMADVRACARIYFEITKPKAETPA